MGAVVQPLALAPDGGDVAGFVGDRLQLWNPHTGATSSPAIDVGVPIGVAFTAGAERLLVVGEARALLMDPDGSDVAALPRGAYFGAARPLQMAFTSRRSMTSGAKVWDARSGKQVAARATGYTTASPSAPAAGSCSRS